MGIPVMIERFVRSLRLEPARKYAPAIEVQRSRYGPSSFWLKYRHVSLRKLASSVRTQFIGYCSSH